jgi:hypothetical protein
MKSGALTANHKLRGDRKEKRVDRPMRSFRRRKNVEQTKAKREGREKGWREEDSGRRVTV